MFSIESADLDFMSRDTLPNFIDGQNGVRIDLRPGPWKYRVDSQIQSLEDKVISLEAKMDNMVAVSAMEQAIRLAHPSVQNAFDQYQLMLKLTVDNTEANDGC